MSASPAIQAKAERLLLSGRVIISCDADGINATVSGDHGSSKVASAAARSTALRMQRLCHPACGRGVRFSGRRHHDGLNLAARPDPASALARVRERVRLTGARLTTEEILDARDADRG